MSIQSSVNSMLSLASRLSMFKTGVNTVKGAKTKTEGVTEAPETPEATQETTATLQEQKATESLKTNQESKRNSRRNFLDYMKNEPTSLGSKFGDLDPKLQKQIAAQYTKSQRKTIMDRKDAANG